MAARPFQAFGKLASAYHWTRASIPMAGTSFTVAEILINSLDSFPRNEKRRALWLYFLRLHNDQDLEPQDVHRICGLHFPGGDFIANTSTLNEAANPSIFGAATQRRATEL